MRKAVLLAIVIGIVIVSGCVGKEQPITTTSTTIPINERLNDCYNLSSVLYYERGICVYNLAVELNDSSICERMPNTEDIYDESAKKDLTHGCYVYFEREVWENFTCRISWVMFGIAACDDTDDTYQFTEHCEDNVRVLDYYACQDNRCMKNITRIDCSKQGGVCIDDDFEEGGVYCSNQATCEKDEECTVVQSYCCSCAHGGTNIAISKELIKYWKQNLGARCKDIACAAVISQDISCCSTAICLNKTCTLKPEYSLMCKDYWGNDICSGETPTKMPIAGEDACSEIIRESKILPL